MEPHNEAMFLRSYLFSMKDAHPMPIRYLSKNAPVKGHWICAVFWSLGILLLSDPSDLRASAPPNILLIMADDLGFSDLGCYGGEIQTPQLNRLASEGLRFTQFYNTARCWPTRGALLSGHYAQSIRRDTLEGVPSGASGLRPSWAKLMPHYLKGTGYRSYHSGKWHVDGMPLANGFDRSYYLKDQGRFFYPKVHWKDDAPLPEVAADANFYATTAIADHAIECLREHAAEYPDRPFFHYVAFTAPHFPLHAREEDTLAYQRVYDQGWDQVRHQRWQRQQAMGLALGPPSEVERDLGPPYAFPQALKVLGPGEVNRPLPWETLNAEQKAFQTQKMILHAAMVDRMDQEIGRILNQLKAMKAEEDTLVLFLSDNGASAEIMVRTDGHDPQVRPGSGPSYLCLGPGWSTACNTPFRKHKTWVHEGGMHTPLIVRWPAGITHPGQWVDQPGHVIDLLPSFLQACGIHENPLPGAGDPSLPGINLLPVLRHPQKRIQRSQPLWWFHEGHRALRQGDWKIVATRDQPWELYDLKTDPQERVNVASENPSEVQAMAGAWQRMHATFQRMAQTP